MKLLQSEGELTIASTGKDPQTGRLVTHEYRVEGPVAIFLTTTAIDVDEELLNRCLVLTVDEDREQTRAIHRLQREAQTLEGLLARQDRDEVLRLHRNAQRLLRPLLVANPFARELTFLDVRTRARRDHVKYLTLIRSIALLRQYQRPLQTVEHRGRAVAYIEVTLDDLEVANRLAGEVLGRSLDELPPQSRRLLERLDRMVADASEQRSLSRGDVRFSRREIREATGWSDFQVRAHLAKLVELEYVMVHRGGQGQRYEYELLYAGEGQDGAPFLPGLIDVEALREPPGATSTTPTSRGAEADFEGPSSPLRGRVEPSSREAETAAKSREENGLEASTTETNGKPRSRSLTAKSGRSRTPPLPLAARAAGAGGER